MGSLDDGGDSLPSLIAKSFSSATEKGQISLYQVTSTSQTTLEGDEGGANVDGKPSFEHVIHVCPEIAVKPLPRSTTPDLATRPKKDVLSGDPEWAPGEHIVDFLGYPIVNNLHALAPEHVMAVAPPPFRNQTSDLMPQDLLVAYRIVQAYAADGRETMCFFNGGPLAGASQPHLHFQFFPFETVPPAPEALARSLPPQATAGTLPLPYLHLYISLPRLAQPHRSQLQSTSNDNVESDSETRDSLHKAYNELLALSKSMLCQLPESELPPKGAKRESYNLFLTNRHLHLVPRTCRMTRIKRIASVGQRDGADHILMSINGLPLAGYWHVGTPEEVKDLKAASIKNILVESCYRSELFKKLDDRAPDI